MTDGATPRPWVLLECNVENCWCACIGVPSDPEGIKEWVIGTGSVSKANAELIVRAVNSHDQLVAALEKIISECEQPTHFIAGTVTRLARAALAAAEADR